MKIHLILLLLFLNTFYCYSRNTVSKRMEYFLFAGKYDDGIKWIEKEKKKGIHLAQLNQYEGDFYKLKGDLEEALVHWRESNSIRTKNYKKKDYHLAWNYALLSNYYFEKIETKLARKYADSCSLLIKHLRPDQQDEIEIYKIWNILAQSNKQFIENQFNGELSIKKYEWVRSFYEKSATFIRTKKLPNYYLAKTYHLIGNSYIDNIHAHIKIHSSKAEIKKVYDKAQENYANALRLWTQTFGIKNHERAKTLYLMGILNMLFTIGSNENKFKLPSDYFDLAIKAFGINTEKLDLKVLKNIPNKEDALQCLRFKNETILKQIEEYKRPDFINTAEKISLQSVNLWEIAYGEFKSENTNQLLGIYNLIPFKDVIHIETLKKQFKRNFSVKRIFLANQKLKYFDLAKQFPARKSKSISLQGLQSKLKRGELFLDFMSNHYNKYYLLAIEKNSVSFVELTDSVPFYINQLNQAIVRMDYKNYVKFGRITFDAIFKQVNLNKYKKLIVCPDGNINELSFETLLKTAKYTNKNDYRKLDYLIKDVDIQYTLSSSIYMHKRRAIPINIGAFAPNNRARGFSELPFSSMLLDELDKMNTAEIYLNENATVRNFLNSTSSIVHFSGHGSVISESSEMSSLVFSDRFLTISEIGLNPSHQLVVLNACNTSNGKLIPGDGVNGFVRAFHAAGTDVTIANLWEVDDQISNKLFLEFYKKIADKSNVASILQNVKIDYIRSCYQSDLAAPYYWAGHRVMGDGDMVSNNKVKSVDSILIKILFSLALIILGLYMLKRLRQ